MKHVKLTMQEHEQLGEELKYLNEYFINLSNRIAKAYGVSKKSSKTAFKVYDLISRLKSEMEEHCYKDYPKKAHTDIYYGKSKSSKFFP